MDGNKKMLAKKRVNFQSENIRLILISILSLYIFLHGSSQGFFKGLIFLFIVIFK